MYRQSLAISAMDDQTISIYNKDAESIATLHNTLIPEQIYQLIDTYFIKDEATADIGCGIGRDTAWLKQQGYPVIGIDASSGMLTQANNSHSDIKFIEDYLPELKLLKDSSFNNILCSAVLMHLSPEALPIACSRLISLLKEGGRLIISFRGSSSDDKRENGKLYESIDPSILRDYFLQQGCTIQLHESEVEESRQLTWHNLVIKK
ncbi:MAG: class I SAM-dependent methyltransferase [Methylophaga sp.]|nr:class I SAM-dependent methyltransferase [Methylophaga sp.]